MSYKAKKEKDITDINRYVITVPTFEYHKYYVGKLPQLSLTPVSRTCGWVDVISQYKSDSTGHVLKQVSYAHDSTVDVGIFTNSSLQVSKNKVGFGRAASTSDTQADAKVGKQRMELLGAQRNIESWVHRVVILLIYADSAIIHQDSD